MVAKLVGVPGSHPCVSAELMFRYKGVEFTRLDLPNMTHKLLLPLLRYRGTTVPVATIDARRVSGTRTIARTLEMLVPEPPLFPADKRDAIEQAEAWADGELQDGIRTLSRWAVSRDEDAMATFLSGPLMGIPEGLVRRALPVLRPIVARQMRPREDAARAALAALPGQLDRVDALLAEGVIGGEQPNAADFQIAPSVRLMLCFDQLRDHVDVRPAGQFARRIVPSYPGRFKAVIPTDWLPF
jgi:glutathione S-transferase